MQRRASRLLWCIGLVVAIVVAMLVRLQVVSPDRYVAKGVNQRTVRFPLVGLRGSIRDRNGEPLAMSLPAKAVVADPRHVTNPEAEAAQLAPVLGLEATVVQSALERPDTGFAYIARQLDPDVAAKVEKLQLAGIDTVDESRRITAADDLALAVVGRMDQFGEIAAYGLEQSADSRLRGRTGARVIERGGDGATIVGSERVETKPADGQSVTLTLDRSMQFWAETALEDQVAKVGAAGGTVIVGRPATGEILAMASVVSSGGEVRPSKLNLAVRTYEPGSVMKVVTAAAGFEEGVVDPTSVFTVPSQIKVGDYKVSDAERHATRDMTVSDIIAESSNVGTIKIAQLIGRERILHYLDGFRFGRMTSLGLQKEQKGGFRREWYGSDIGSIPIGQSITATPLQVWNVYNTIANRGVYVAPRLVQSWTGTDGIVTRPRPPTPHRVISVDASMKVTQALEKVIEEGTGKKWAIPGYNIAAKTGTAYEPVGGGVRGYGTGGNRHYAASFAGFFPATNPQLSIMVMVDAPQYPNHFGTIAAGPVFDRLAKEAMRLYGISGDAASVEAGTASHPVKAQAAAAPTTSTTSTAVSTTTTAVSTSTATNTTVVGSG